MSYSTGPARISVSIFSGTGIETMHFKSGEELLDYALNHNAGIVNVREDGKWGGGWGGESHLHSLMRLRRDLDATIANVLNEVIEERGERAEGATGG